MEPDGSWHVHESMPLSTHFLPISLRVNITFASHLHQFLPNDVMPLESDVPYTQEIPHCTCTQFLLLCSQEHTLFYILSKLMLVHTVRHISERHIFNISLHRMHRFLYCSPGILVSLFWDGKTVQSHCASYCAQKSAMCTVTLLV